MSLLDSQNCSIWRECQVRPGSGYCQFQLHRASASLQRSETGASYLVTVPVGSGPGGTAQEPARNQKTPIMPSQCERKRIKLFMKYLRVTYGGRCTGAFAFFKSEAEVPC